MAPRKQNENGLPADGARCLLMKKHLFLLVLLFLLPALPALAFHDHVDLEGAPTLISGYRAPTETEDGSTGDEVCSVCGAVVKHASPIPAVGKQRKTAEEEKPNAAPVPAAPDSAPADHPTPVPTAVPTPVPTPPPTAAPKASEEKSASSEQQASDPAPAAPTAQPDLPREKEGRKTSSPSESAPKENSAGARSGSSSGGRNRRSAFSARFPWRRLRMNPEAGILLPLAGRLVWPVPEVSSPLMIIMNPVN